jgi:hypothetical protein
VTRVAVLGTGMGACGAVHRLAAEGLTPVMYDMNAYHGAHTTSFEHPGGFVFDIGPHISYTKNPRIQALFAASVDDQYKTLQIHLNNYWQGYWPVHPVQLHLHGLPEELVIKVIADFVAEHHAPERLDQRLRGLALGELRANVRRDVPDAVHAQVPPDGLIDDSRVAFAPDLPTALERADAVVVVTPWPEFSGRAVAAGVTRFPAGFCRLPPSL